MVMKSSDKMWKNAKCIYQLQFHSLKQKSLKLDEMIVKFTVIFYGKRTNLKLLRSME
jgi:hypothetical protein